ncbi:MAG TPA: outer membrane protein assembly factor BamD [Ignavibacteria bacterium]
MKTKKLSFPQGFTIFAFLIAAIFYLSGCSSSGSKIDTDDPQAAFDIAKRKFDRKDYVEAIEDFSLLKIRFPGTEISDKVQFYTAESYFYQKEYLLAAYEYETFLKSYPSSLLYPEARYKLGLSYYYLSPKYSLDQEFTRFAINEFLGYIEQFPQDKNVYDAEQKIKELKNKLAFKDFSIAENYMKLDNNRSAAIYYQSVYENYIESDWADDAMVGHAEALINGRKYEDAKKVLEKFYKFFPKSNLKPKADMLNARIREGQI